MVGLKGERALQPGNVQQVDIIQHELTLATDEEQAPVGQYQQAVILGRVCRAQRLLDRFSTARSP